MKKQNNVFGIKKGDVAVFSLLCLICVLLFLLPLLKNSDSKTAVITVDGEIYKTIELLPKENQRFSVSGCVLTVQNGEIRFESANCPDKLCVKCGALSKVTDTAACVPNKVVVTISGKSKNNYDTVAY